MGGSTTTQTVNVTAPFTGTLTLDGPATATAGGTATFTAPADQDVTYEVFRGSTLIERKVGSSFSYSSAIATTDTVKACVNSGLPCADGVSRTIEWQPAAGWNELWDATTLAGWTYCGAGSIARNSMTALGTAGGATAANPGSLTYSARTFKDFHLQLKYRATATSNNGGVLVRGRQVAILDNGTADTRTGAIIGAAPAASAQAKPVREWNTLDVIAYGGKLTSRVNGVEVASASLPDEAGSIGLENAGNNLMYADVRIKDAGRRHDRADDHDPQRPGRPDAAPGHAVHGRLRVRRRAGPRRVHGDGDRRRHARPLHVQGHRQGRRRQRDDRHPRLRVVAYTTATGSAGGSVAATLALTLGTPAPFGAFTPGVAKDYTASTTANVISTAGDADAQRLRPRAAR